MRPSRLACIAEHVCASRDPTQLLVGRPVGELPTPALLVDLDSLEHNIRVMSGKIRGEGALWRPHTKAIRTPLLAQRLVSGGAVGVTCAKLSQAAALVDGGIKDVLIANEIVGEEKVNALVTLAGRCKLCVACDNESNLRHISAEAAKAGVTVGVLVDINIGMNRCGILWSNHAEISKLSTLASQLPGIRYDGLVPPHPLPSSRAPLASYAAFRFSQANCRWGMTAITKVTQRPYTRRLLSPPSA